MRKRIQQLVNGTFEYARPILTLSTEKVEIEVLEGRDYTGDFVITSANRVPMKGVIYTSNPRMECLTPQFEGEEVRIRYQFHSNGFTEGDILKGEFFIVCNQGEYNLSFVASVSRLYAESSIGKIKNLSEFARLARANFEEASRLFYSQNFKNIIRADEQREMLLYQGLRKGGPSGQKVDEFLAGIHKKKAFDLELSQDYAEFTGVTEVRKEKLELKRNQWGYVDIRVSSDAAFLIPEKRRIKEEDFLGSVCIFEYYVDETYMHAGNNYGRLSFEIPGRVIQFSVCASRKEKQEHLTSDHRQIKEAKIRLLQLYMDYRLKKIVTGAWANQSVELLDHLMALSPQEPLYRLMKAQAYIINKQRQEASWIMEEFKREWKNREDAVWGYYLYLCTLTEREPTYVDRLTEEIETLFHRHPRSSLLFWILLFVREDYYRNGSKRLKAIEQWVARGNCSPYLYLEAYYLIWQDPYLLGRLGCFEVKVLNWACRQGAVTKDIALEVMHIVPEKREFHPFIYRILKECYLVYPEDEMLMVICGYLIRGQRFDAEYHKWYELGIEHEIRLTSLYEAYLMSLDSKKVGNVPKMIQMYFQYNSHLSYQQKAVLFVNIIAGKALQPEVYQKYRRSMEQFAMEQLESGHINDNLAVVYDEMLKAGILNTELARRLAKILFTHKLTCPSANMARAYILSKQLKSQQEVVFTGETAYFNVYTDDYCVVLEDSQGNRFSESILYQDEPLMNPDAYIATCLSLVPDELCYILYYFREKRCSRDFTEGDGIYFSILLQSEKVSDSYKVRLIPEIIRYYQKKEDDGSKSNGLLEKYLTGLDFGMLIPEDRRYLTELLVRTHLFEKAYQVIQIYGYDDLKSTVRVSLCSYAITECGFEEDDFLIGFTGAVFVEGKYNDVMLMYLCKYYHGATKIMAELWKAALEFQIDTFELEERILIQMLYTTEYVEYAEQIYDSYYAGGGQKEVCMAYLTYFSQSYFVRDAVIPEHVFIQLQERYLQGEKLNDACRLGLLKHFAEREKLTGRQFLIADELLLDYTGRNIYFSFYRRLEKKLVLKYDLYDRFFLEYHTEPSNHVLVYYRMGKGDYIKEELTEMYDGIFVKEFILFFGESVQYYITENDGISEKVTESNCIINHDIVETDCPGKYAQLNEMLQQLALQDTGALIHAMKNYYGMQQVTEEIFDLL